MYSFELTEDVSLIKSVLAHPACYRKLHDDYAPPREEWEPLMGEPMVKYISCSDEQGEVLGMFQANLHSAVEVEMHTAFLPKAWGRDVRAAVREGIQWIWDTFPTVHRIIGKILDCNAASLHYAEAVGLKVFGIDKRSFMYQGQLQDQVYVGISRPGVA